MRAIKKIALGPNQLLRNEHIRNAFGNFMMNQKTGVGSPSETLNLQSFAKNEEKSLD
jgi:hypothetical protein